MEKLTPFQIGCLIVSIILFLLAIGGIVMGILSFKFKINTANGFKSTKGPKYEIGTTVRNGLLAVANKIIIPAPSALITNALVTGIPTYTTNVKIAKTNTILQTLSTFASNNLQTNLSGTSFTTNGLLITDEIDLYKNHDTYYSITGSNIFGPLTAYGKTIYGCFAAQIQRSTPNQVMFTFRVRVADQQIAFITITIPASPGNAAIDIFLEYWLQVMETGSLNCIMRATRNNETDYLYQGTTVNNDPLWNFDGENTVRLVAMTTVSAGYMFTKLISLTSSPDPILP